MRPAVAGKQVRTPMPLQPSTVVDDDSCEIGDERVARHRGGRALLSFGWGDRVFALQACFVEPS